MMNMKLSAMIETARKIATPEMKSLLDEEIASYKEYPSNYAMACVLRVLARIIEEG